MQESVGVLSLPSLGAAPQLDLPPPHREPWPLNAAAVAAALLLHALVVLFLLWPFLTSMLWPQKPPPTEVAIPITIVQEQPKPPSQLPREVLERRAGSGTSGAPPPDAAGSPETQASPATPAEEPPASPTENETESPLPSDTAGSAEHTTVIEPSPAGDVAETPSLPPAANQQTATLPLPTLKPANKAKQKSPQKKAAQSAPELGRSTGDRYLRAIKDRIEQVRSYPPLARGRQLRGSAQYAVAIDRAGHVLNVRLLLSTGYDMLDREGERMIRAAAPLPELPPEVPGERVELAIGVNIYPYP